ncbi:MAG: hypothetical protein K6B67_04885 [Lachnospiraceae bacterium]|nr:hypothetical protein [Lachnospiraceae bacterium]
MWSKKKQTKPGSGDFYLNGELVSSNSSKHNENDSHQTSYEKIKVDDITNQGDAYFNQVINSGEKIAKNFFRTIIIIFAVVIVVIVVVSILFSRMSRGISDYFSSQDIQKSESVVSAFAYQDLQFKGVDIILGETTLQEFIDNTGCTPDMRSAFSEGITLYTLTNQKEIRLDIHNENHTVPTEDTFDDYVITGIIFDTDCGEDYSIWGITPTTKYQDLEQLYGRPSRYSGYPEDLYWKDKDLMLSIHIDKNTGKIKNVDASILGIY